MMLLLQELSHRLEEESSSYSLELECVPPQPSTDFQTARYYKQPPILLFTRDKYN